MNCWEILGIEPTGDRRKIQDAYEQQLKFASEDEAKSLEAAFREAVGDDPGPVKQASDTVQTEPHREVQDEEPDRPLDANEGQVVREVVIQIKALLNDSSRSKDRPMAENGTFPAPVAQFLGEWFDWFTVEQAPEAADDRNYPEPDMAEEQGEQPPQMVNFWPAVIGWIVGLAILATLFGGMGGG